ncbi:uncharacterized protein [Spinacia oleracea]|uniref:Granulins domain-containing protein n=1 Tax=Spinacia oleracea TaxID=3562 RepID=A0ABM3R741_SPIOL|nr:uncharacterized protein LOC130466887 [Spinacia oleracea]
MENNVGSRRIILAVCFVIFASMVVQQISAQVCTLNYDDACVQNSTPCCKPGLICTQVKPLTSLPPHYKCKEGPCPNPEHPDEPCPCEEHSGHECYPGLFECCPHTGLQCVSQGSDSYLCL